MGWYVKEYLGGKFINVVFRHTLSPSTSGSLTLTNAVNGATIKNALGTQDLVLFDVFAYATSITAVEVLPDADQTERFTVDALPTGTRVPIMPPKLVEVDFRIDYETPAVPVEVYLNFSCMIISEANLIKFTTLAEGIADLTYANKNLVNIQKQQVEMLKAMINILYVDMGKTPPYPFDTGLSSAVLPMEQFSKRRSANFCDRKTRRA